MKTNEKNASQTKSENVRPVHRERRDRLVTDILAKLHAGGGGCQGCTSCCR